MYVYVLSKDGAPLMPTKRCGKVRRMLRDGKAEVAIRKPFTIRLLYETTSYTQRLVCGIDPGRTNIGTSVVKEDGTEVFAGHLETRNKEIPKLMEKRKAHRQARRRHKRDKRMRRARRSGTVMPMHFEHSNMGTRPLVKYSGRRFRFVNPRKLQGCDQYIYLKDIKNKEARFNNRKRKDKWLTPTANQLLESHVNLLKRMCKFLPISDVVLELNNFAFMELDNPNIQKWEYSHGPLYGYDGVREAVYAMQDGMCLLCKHNPIEELHYMQELKNFGSKALANTVGLCASCQRAVHTDDKARLKISKLHEKRNKKYGALSVLNQIVPHLADKYSELFPEHSFVTKASSTHNFREEHYLDKDHDIDAYCIACSILSDAEVSLSKDNRYELKQFKRHDRAACHKEMLSRYYILDGKVVAANRRKATEQESDSLKEYVLSGGRTDNLKVKPHKRIYKRMKRIMPGACFKVGDTYKIMRGSTGLYKGEPQYYVFTDKTKARPKCCILKERNKGIVFI